MEEKNSGSSFDSRFNKLVSEEEISTDEQMLYTNQEKQQVSMSMVGPESGLRHFKLLTVSLAVLAVILLSANIGMGAYYHRLTDGLHLITDIDSELAKLHASYNKILKRWDDVNTEFVKIKSEQQLTSWEIEHQERRCKSYRVEAERIQLEITSIKSHLAMIKEGCKQCSAGWILVNSMCYFFPFSNDLSVRGWHEARAFCRDQGGDLAVIDNSEKNLAVNQMLNTYTDPSRHFHRNGFWIGLTDAEEENTWKWVNGELLTEGYWIPGEPNNAGGEDCAASYPRGNPFASWNDAPCSFNLKWICEMAPRFSI